ncbi:MAG: hypothetical protein ACK4NX_01755, partial [Candidatus Paceibacteria bacterium]
MFTYSLRTAIYIAVFLSLVGILIFLKNVSGRIKSYTLLRDILGWQQAALVLMFAAYLGILWQVMIWDSKGLPFSVLVGWGDGAYHLDIISRLANSKPFSISQPIAAGQPLTYPFMIDFLSAIFKAIGLNDAWSWHIPPFVLGIGLFFLVYSFGKKVLGSRSWAVAFLFLIFFGAGLGFLWFFQDIKSAWDSNGVSGVIEALWNPPHEYTHLDNRTGGKPKEFDAPLNIVWMVPAVSFFSHQRSFIAGAGISILFLLGLWIYRNDQKIMPIWLMLLGLLPLLHTHSFVSLTIITLSIFFLTLLEERKLSTLISWAIGGIFALIFALPQVLFLSQAGFLGKEAGGSFFKPWFGWMTCTHSNSWFFCDRGVPGTDVNPFWFWTKNFGVIFLFWILALIYFKNKKGPRDLKVFVLPSIIMFLVPNLILLQPWEFDNNKALFYWWLFAALFALTFLKDGLRNDYTKAAIIFLFLVASGLSGTVDVFARIKNGILTTLSPGKTPYHFTYYGDDEIEIAKWIKENTNPNDAFLTVDWANQSIPMLTGRPIYLGFPGWLWTQGRGELVAERQRKIQNFVFSGNPQE